MEFKELKEEGLSIVFNMTVVHGHVKEIEI